MTKIFKNRSRSAGFFLSVAVVTGALIAFGACTAATAPASFNPGAGGEICSGCPCEDDDQAPHPCHELLSQDGQYITCQEGITRCVNHQWTACEGDKVVLRSTEQLTILGSTAMPLATQASSKSGQLHLRDIADAAKSCANVCNPDCSSFVDDGVNLDAGSTGLTLTEGGGLTLLGEAGVGCYGLSCAVNHSCPAGGHTKIHGKIFDPAHRLGIPNVYAYVPNSFPEPFPAGVHADQCGGGGTLTGDPLPTPVQSDYTGAFTLLDVPTGTNVPVVIQVGRWRKQVTIPNVTDCGDTDVGDITLPSKQNQGSPFDNIPQIAVTAGGCEALECLLYRMGIDVGEFTSPTGPGRVHFYRTNYGSTLAAGPTPYYDTLVGDVNQLAKYDLVFQSCDCGLEYNYSGTDRTLQDVTTSVTYAQAHNNIRSYMAMGGRMYTTDFGREWIENPPSAAFPGVATWDNQRARYIPGKRVTANTTFPHGALFGQWMTYNGLTMPYAPAVPFGNVIAAIPPTANWLTQVDLVNRSNTGQASTEHTNITFDTPLGSPVTSTPPGGYVGKVAFADEHVEQSQGQPFPDCFTSAWNRDEAALEYLIFDLSSCVSSYGGPVTYPGPSTYTRVYQASCPAGKIVKWRLFDWRGATPSTSRIGFKVGTAKTNVELSTATFVPLVTPDWHSALPVTAPAWVSADVTAALAGNGLVSREFLAVKMTLFPSLDGGASPTLYQWAQEFDCVDNQ